jgi:hypothetical protein
MNTNREPQALERELLGAICASGMTAGERDRTLAMLANYAWQSPDHRVLFVALQRARQRGDATALHEFLTAEVTRLGFPDFDLESYFASPQLDAEQMARISDALLASSCRAASQALSRPANQR